MGETSRYADPLQLPPLPPEPPLPPFSPLAFDGGIVASAAVAERGQATTASVSASLWFIGLLC
jgi:hypothetical protein